MDVTAVAARIRDLDAGRHCDEQHAGDLARMLGRREVIGEVIVRLLDDERAIDAVASRSFHHSNHFDKLVLVGDTTCAAYRLTIHLWRPPYSSAEVDDEQIHDHRCNFWSTVLFGCVRSTEFARDPSGELYGEVRYSPSWSASGVKHNCFRHVGTAQLRAVRHPVHQAGSTYHLPWHTIHRISISERPVASLVLRGPHVAAESSVFRTGEPYTDADLPPLAPDVVRDDLRFILKSIR